MLYTFPTERCGYLRVEVQTASYRMLKFWQQIKKQWKTFINKGLSSLTLWCIVEHVHGDLDLGLKSKMSTNFFLVCYCKINVTQNDYLDNDRVTTND